MQTTEKKREYNRKFYCKHRKEILACQKANYENYKIYRKSYFKHNPWAITQYSIYGRCSNSKNRSYYRYGGRGIKNFLTCKDLKFLWFRDKAYLMKRPSIDRKDNDGNYTLKNCRFMELSENISYHRRKYSIEWIKEQLSKGIKQKEMARIQGVSFQTISKFIKRWGLGKGGKKCII